MSTHLVIASAVVKVLKVHVLKCYIGVKIPLSACSTLTLYQCPLSPFPSLCMAETPIATLKPRAQTPLIS